MSGQSGHNITCRISINGNRKPKKMYHISPEINGRYGDYYDHFRSEMVTVDSKRVVTCGDIKYIGSQMGGI